MTSLAFPALTTPRDVEFDGDIVVKCRPITSISRDQAMLRAYGLVRDLIADSSALEEEYGIPADQARDLSEASPLGFTKYLEAVLMAEASFVSWSGHITTPQGKIDLTDTEMTPADIAVFCLKPWRASRLQNFIFEDDQVAEGNA